MTTILAITSLLVLVATTAAAGARSKHHPRPAWQQRWQYRWQVWLPDKWQRVGACETGYGKRPGNWHWQNSGYVSAFGISRNNYDHDAAVMGGPPWNDKRNPTPWQQYRAALGHYRLHGGFSGWGCRNA